MRKIVGFIAGLAMLAPGAASAAAFVVVANPPGSVIVMDRDSLIRTGDVTRAWYYTIQKDADPDGLVVRGTLADFDCRKLSNKLLQLTKYKATGEMFDDYRMEDSAWHSVDPPPKIGGLILQAVCAKDSGVALVDNNYDPLPFQKVVSASREAMRTGQLK